MPCGSKSSPGHAFLFRQPHNGSQRPGGRYRPSDDTTSVSRSCGLGSQPSLFSMFGQSPRCPFPVELTSQSASAAVRTDLTRRLTSLASIAATASFDGFFGTVWGIMKSFSEHWASKSAALAAVTSRISDAMIPGILGLFVAVTAFWFHQYLRNQLQAFDVDMQNASVDLVNRLTVHLERVRTANSAVWRALSGIPRKAAIHLEALAEHILAGPWLVWGPMYRRGGA